MNTILLDRLKADFQQLTLTEQMSLLAHLIQQLLLSIQLTLMATDPQIQHESGLIQSEFAETDADGLVEDTTSTGYSWQQE
jgi:hypothetical protein